MNDNFEFDGRKIGRKILLRVQEPINHTASSFGSNTS